MMGACLMSVGKAGTEDIEMYIPARPIDGEGAQK